jgi:hypothetical protein
MPNNEKLDEKDETNKKSYMYKTFKSSYIGVTQMMLAFGLTHPLDLFKTNMQASLKSQNSFDLIKQQLRKGPSSFYIAAIPNFSRVFFKELYRSPLRGFLKKFYNENLPANMSAAYPDLKNVLTGLTLSITDTFILCPLERVKVWIMTNSDRNRPLRQFFVNNNGQPILRNLFRGLNVSFCRSTVSWISYLTIEEKIRLYLCKKFSKSQEDVPISLQVLIGAFSGACNLLLTHPFDTVKTQIQKKDATTSKSFLRALIDLYRTNGLGGVYSGWQFRLPSYIIVAVITSSNIQKIDKIWNS